MPRSSVTKPLGGRENSPADELRRLVRVLFVEAGRLGAAAAEATGLHPTDVAAARALDAAAGSGPLTVGELGRALGLSSAAVTGLVDRLERAGLVERARDEADRRKVRVRPTPRARAVGEALLRPVAARTEAAIGQLDDAQVEVVGRFLGTVLGEDGAEH